MRTVRWAQVALLAVVPACAHTSSGKVENASTTAASESREATAEMPADLHAATLAERNDHNTMGRRTRFISLGSAQIEVPTTGGQPVVAEAPTCSPWAADTHQRCLFEEAVSQRLR